MSLNRALTRLHSAWFVLLASSPLVAADFTSHGRDFLKENCSECHDEDVKKGGLRVDRLSLQQPGPDELNLLVRLFDRVKTGEMPPRNADQPTPAARQEFLAELGKGLVAAETELARPSGRTLVRRMNRVEYEHALRDLLALPLLRVGEMLPEDGQQFGYDKVAGALDISHIQMAKYLQASDAALRQAVVKAGSRPETKVWREPAARQNTARASVNQKVGVPINGRALAPGLVSYIAGDPVKDFGNSYRAMFFNGEADSFAVLSSVIGAHQAEGIQIDRFNPPVPGWYRVRFSVWGLRWERTKAVAATRGMVRAYTTLGPPYFKDEKGQFQATPLPPEQLAEKRNVRERMENVEFYGEGEATQIVRASLKGVPLGYFDAPSLKPATHEFKVWLNPGERVSFHSMTLPAGGPLGGGTSQGALDYEGPGVAYDWFEVEGPLIETWPPESQRRLFGEIPVNAHPRPPLAGATTVGAGGTAKLPLADFKGAGQMLGTDRLLNLSGTTTARFNCAVTGEYEVAVTAFETHAGSEPAKMRLLVDDRELPRAPFAVNALRTAPERYRAKFRVESAGPVELGIEFMNDFLDEKNPDPILRDRNLFIAGVEVAGPKNADAAAPAAGGHRDLLAGFAARAFRRPVALDEITPYSTIVEAQLQGGSSFEEAMLAGCKGILCSPDFLLIGIESGVPLPAKNGPAKLGEYALASRLSFFLWNSMPDATLLDLAASKTLSRPATLRAQVVRMLADPRSERFVEHFLDEWLELKRIDFTTPDPNLYPEYDPWLHDSMLAESRAWFRRLLTQNRGVREVIAADTVLVNQRLAELYGIRGVNGADLREVKLPQGSPRGGFLTQAAVLKVTANGTATSPVLRGVWVTERLLGIPRRPPPPNIPAVEPDATGAVTIRQMIEQHRADSACAGCHAKMDPPGMALENFDVIGGWRDRYRLAGQPKTIRKGKEVAGEPFVEIVSDAARRNRIKLRLGSEVDATGELWDGRTFADVNGLRELLLKDEDALARNVARQLMIYATGAGIRFSDRQAIEAIVAATKPTRHGLRSLVQEVVASELFQTK
jgi:hypothetical protein